MNWLTFANRSKGTPKTLEEYEEDVHSIMTQNGWYTTDRTFGDDVALLHSEVSEMLEAYRSHGLSDQTVGDKPEGVGSEAADVMIRLLDTCRRYGINLRYEVERKNAYNATRGYRHGNKKL